MPDVDALTKDADEFQSAKWDESRLTLLVKGMYFSDKARLTRTVKMYSVRECREMTETGLWKVGKYISTHVCEMNTFNENHFNLDVDLISLVLIPHLEVSIRYKIKACIISVHQEYGCTITKRKAYLGCKHAFEIIYGDRDKLFSSLPRYMAALKQFNPGTVVEWRHERSPRIPEYIFRYVLLAFKPAIDGFVHCSPVIFIDGTHVYGKYDIKLLIDVAVDVNGQIFPLAFSICANESEEKWMLFLNHLKQHETYAYHRYCVRHLKASFQKKYPTKELHDLMWMAATEHQQCKFRRRMEAIRQLDERAYNWELTDGT
ncbi:uncharacterized protein [Nicotiana sylvestris]|uniref:uncharacterized protein n=1 Tax=Nicotiana sylvestris TaxID=4096 RepID=UPI00388C99B2